jgi:hypothetical protein
MAGRTEFQLEVDAGAREWLDSHPATRPRVLAYDVHRCCGGGKICRVSVREGSSSDDPETFATGALGDGTTLLIDRRAAARLPARFTLTLRGFWRLKHLDLALEAEQWGTLLYD